MSNFPDLLTSFDDIVEALKVKLSQDPSKSTTYNGEQIQSIAKDIEDKWAAIQALVNSAKVFETKVLMDAFTPTPDAEGFYPLATVWNDTDENSGVYGYSGGVWIKSPYDVASQAYQLSIDLQSTKQSKLSAFTVQNLIMIPDMGLTGGGGLAAATDYETSEMVQINEHPAVVRVTSGMTYSFAHRLVSYDKDGNATSVMGQSSENVTNEEVALPADSVAFRLCNHIPKGVTAAASTAYDIAQNLTLRLNDIELDDVSLPGVIESDVYVNRNGGISNLAGMEVVTFDCLPGEELLITGYIPGGAFVLVAFYDTEKNLIESIIADYGLTYVDEPVVVPANAVTVKVTNQIAGGYTATAYRQPASAAAASVIQVQDMISDVDHSDFYLKGLSKPVYQIDSNPIGLIVLGQSNTDGRAENLYFPIDWTEDSQTYSYSKALSNVKICKNNRDGVFSPMNVTGQWAYDSIVQNKISQLLGGADFYTVKRSHGGTALNFKSSESNFNPDIAQFNGASGITAYTYELELAIRNAMAANPELEFKAILFHQGESDGDQANRMYYRDLARLVYYIRGVVGNASLPFIFGTIPSNSLSYRDYIHADFLKLSQEVENVYLIDMEGQPLLEDSLHFDHIAQEYLGDQMYQILKSNHLLVRD